MEVRGRQQTRDELTPLERFVHRVDEAANEVRSRLAQLRNPIRSGVADEDVRST